jgi:hypothetical protein
LSWGFEILQGVSSHKKIVFQPKKQMQYKQMNMCKQSVHFVQLGPNSMQNKLGQIDASLRRSGRNYALLKLKSLVETKRLIPNPLLPTQ